MRAIERAEPGWTLAKERGLWRTTGMQDAANVMDANEVEEDLGSKWDAEEERWVGPEPTAAQIKKWLLDSAEKKDFEFDSQLELTESEEDSLLEAWADGWSGFAKARIHERRNPSHRSSR